jgi:hypothetical protein
MIQRIRRQTVRWIPISRPLCGKCVYLASVKFREPNRRYPSVSYAAYVHKQERSP